MSSISSLELSMALELFVYPPLACFIHEDVDLEVLTEQVLQSTPGPYCRWMASLGNSEIHRDHRWLYKLDLALADTASPAYSLWAHRKQAFRCHDYCQNMTGRGYCSKNLIWQKVVKWGKRAGIAVLLLGSLKIKVVVHHGGQSSHKHALDVLDDRQSNRRDE